MQKRVPTDGASLSQFSGMVLGIPALGLGIGFLNLHEATYLHTYEDCQVFINLICTEKAETSIFAKSIHPIFMTL